MNRLVLALATHLIVLALIPAAFAQAPAATNDAESLIRRGVELRRANDDAGALENFNRAWELSHSARARAQGGLAEQALGRWVVADAHLREALAMNDPWIVANRAALQASLDSVQTHLGTLDVRGGIAGAHVSINGQDVGTLPFAHPMRLEVGTVTMEVTAQGYYAVSRPVTIAPGGLARESIELRPDPHASTVSVGMARGSSTPDADAQHGTTAASSDSPWRPLPIALGIGGVVFIAVGAIANVLREGAAAHWNDDSMCLVGGQTREQNCGSYEQTANTMEGLAIAGYVVGGAAMVVAAVMVLTHHGNADQHTARLTCGSGPGQIGAGCAWTF